MMSEGTRTRVLDSRGRPVPGLYVKNGNFIAGFNDPTSGKWRMQSLSAKDLSAARRERESLLSGLREGRIAAKNDSTVSGVFTDWQQSRRISERTARNERSLLDSHLSTITTKRVQDVTTSEVAAAMKMSGYSEWTRVGVYRLAQGLFAHARRRDLVTKNPCDGLGPSERPSQRNQNEIRVLDVAEVERLIAATKNPKWRTAIALMALAGLRLGEMRGLRWSDVNEITIRVSRSAAPLGEIGGPKTKAGIRDVPLDPQLRRLLAAWRLESPRSRDEDLIVGRKCDLRRSGACRYRRCRPPRPDTRRVRTS